MKPSPVLSSFKNAWFIKFFLAPDIGGCKRNIHSCTPDRDFRCFYPCEIFLSHTPIPVLAKDKKQTATRWPHAIRDVIVILKWCHNVTFQRIQKFLEAFFKFSNINDLLSGEQEKNPLFLWGWDRKIRPLQSPIVITRQASWCQTAILGTDFSIPSSHSWKIFIVKPVLKGTATLMITMFYMKDLNKPWVLIPVSSKSVEKRRSYGCLNICKWTVKEAATL